MQTTAFTISLTALLLGAAPAKASDTGTLNVVAAGFSNTDGPAIAKLFMPGDNVLVHGRWQRIAKVGAGLSAKFQFTGLAPGQYAVVVFHDENGDGEINHRLSVPIEQLGFSAGFQLGIFSGLPTFDKLKFELGPREQTIDIQVRYVGAAF